MAASERSTIARRRKPSPTRPSSATQVAPPSGPRCASVSRIRVTYVLGPRGRARLAGRALRRFRTSASDERRGAHAVGEERGDHVRGPLARAPVPERDLLGYAHCAAATESRRSAGAGPSIVFVPSATVTGRSVSPRNVKQGTPSAEASSWTPPESVSTDQPRTQAGEREVAERLRQSDAAAKSLPMSPPVRSAPPSGGGPGTHIGTSRRARQASDGASSRLVDVGGPVQGHEAVTPGIEPESHQAPAREPAPHGRTARRSSCCRRVEPLSAMPSASRFSASDAECRRSTSLTWSVSLRLISSGIVGSSCGGRLDWATGMPSFTAASADASVELTSPATTTSSGRSSRSPARPRDRACGLLAVAAGPDAEEEVGRREPELAEETSDIAGS